VNAARRRGENDDAMQRPDSGEILSALEETLRHALASVPRDQVLKTIVAALPVEVLLEDSGRLHGSKVRKVSVSMPEELTEAVRARTGAGGFSRYVTDAVEEQIRLDLMDDLIAEFEAEHGPVPEELVEEAMREWPDYEDE
jgi:Arc/MetJ-type ribon-helix-helix transcriptional regulator